MTYIAGISATPDEESIKFQPNLSTLLKFNGTEIDHMKKSEILSFISNNPHQKMVASETNPEQISKNLDVLNPLIQKAAVKYNLDPALLRAIILLESGGNVFAISPTGAYGVMQLTSYIYNPNGTKQFFKTPINPFNPEEAIDRGAAFLAYLRDNKYGNDLLKIAAAYNQGEQIVDKALDMAHETRENWKEFIPAEAQKYTQNIQSLVNLNHPAIYRRDQFVFRIKKEPPKKEQEKKRNFCRKNRAKKYLQIYSKTSHHVGRECLVQKCPDTRQK